MGFVGPKRVWNGFADELVGVRKQEDRKAVTEKYADRRRDR